MIFILIAVFYRWEAQGAQVEMRKFKENFYFWFYRYRRYLRYQKIFKYLKNSQNYFIIQNI